MNVCSWYQQNSCSRSRYRVHPKFYTEKNTATQDMFKRVIGILLKGRISTGIMTRMTRLNVPFTLQNISPSTVYSIS